MTQVSLDTLINAAHEGDRLISIPTDTIPALASRPETAAMIYVTKQRSLTKPLILMASHQDELWGYVQQDHPAFDCWQQVAFWFWPGALTLVLPASQHIPRAVNPTNPTTIGLRVPNCAIARHILHRTGPLATTSVNRSGHPPLETIDAINKHFPEVLTLSPATVEEWQGMSPVNVMQLLQSKEQRTQLLAKQPLDPYATLTIPLPSPPLSTMDSSLPSPQNSTPSTVIRWGGKGWELLRQGGVILPAYFFEPVLG